MGFQFFIGLLSNRVGTGRASTSVGSKHIFTQAYSQTVGQSSQGIPQSPGALRPADLRIIPSLSCDLLSCQLNYLRASPFLPNLSRPLLRYTHRSILTPVLVSITRFIVTSIIRGKGAAPYE